MRLCYVASGTSIHTKRWVNYFARRGHEVHLISSRFTEGYEGFDNSIQMHPLVRLLPQIWKLSGYLSGILWLFQVRRLVERIRPDVVDAHYVAVPAYLAVASGFHPLVLSAWGSDILTIPKQNPVYGFFTKQALKRADLVVCRSSLMRDEIVKLGTSPSRIEICFLGVNTNQFSPAQKTDEFRQKLNIDSSALVVISTRSHKPIYDLETLIRAVPLVLREVPMAEFVIAGDGEQRKSLMNLAQGLRVMGNTRFVGWIPHDSLPHYLASSDVYVSTSLSDGVPNSLLEAMACGLASVVTNIPANQSWIGDGKHGFLVPIRDPKTLADRITFLLKNAEIRSNFSESSVKRVKEKAEHEVQMNKLERLYIDLVKDI